jgi:ketosteroid isomerase-like protein
MKGIGGLSAVVLGGALLAGCAGAPKASADRVDTSALAQQVTAAERAFAKTMADRDFAGFGRYVADDALFYSGLNPPLRGRAAVLEHWKRFFDQPQAPFAWEPDKVDVLDNGTLAYSSGPVKDASGKVVSRFNSVWRQDAPGVWRVVFDRGEAVCDCAKK